MTKRRARGTPSMAEQCLDGPLCGCVVCDYEWMVIEEKDRELYVGVYSLLLCVIGPAVDDVAT